MAKNKYLTKQIKADCCGCEVCAFVCPQKIIIMQWDDEGFIYPQIINPDLCVDCGLCEKVCPISNPTKANDSIIAFSSGYMESEEEIKRSASGGLATAISRGFIAKNNGIVYGVRYSDDFESIIYERATSQEALEKFRGSKYAQAFKGKVYQKIIKDLNDGLNVLFIGLPCEVAALLKLVKKKYSTLYTIELVCHGPTSPKVHKEFVRNLSKDVNTKVNNFTVRHKISGYRPYYVLAEFENNNTFMRKFHESEYGIAFRYLKRPSCAKCIFKLNNKKAGLQGDMTIGDFHYAHEGMAAYNKWGCSVAYIHSLKGKILIDYSNSDFLRFPTDAKPALKSSFALNKTVKERINRNQFAKKFITQGLAAACKLNSINLLDGYIAFKGKIMTTLVKTRNLIVSLLYLKFNG
ncbi:Coenzyme F420 hydrogenase/dehydrogenase, beta subunit C-terminal domain [Parabacteroides segnis]|uniref:Coenzyme F420 hydrogenase/dehydrogenase, beta subunit C-terminal domain n=1 Tax=Parabacteroides segnis TaxID=2763058 RepID=UPI003516468B